MMTEGQPPTPKWPNGPQHPRRARCLASLRLWSSRLLRQLRQLRTGSGREWSVRRSERPTRSRVQSMIEGNYCHAIDSKKAWNTANRHSAWQLANTRTYIGLSQFGRLFGFNTHHTANLEVSNEAPRHSFSDRQLHSRMPRLIGTLQTPT